MSKKKTDTSTLPAAATAVKAAKATDTSKTKTKAASEKPAAKKASATKSATTAAKSTEAKPRKAAAKTNGAPAPAPISHDDIARLAYSYAEARGFTGGSAEADWYRAEQELRGIREA